MKRWIKVLVLFIILVGLLIPVVGDGIKYYKTEKKYKKGNIEEVKNNSDNNLDNKNVLFGNNKEESLDLNVIMENYSDYVKTKEGAILYKKIDDGYVEESYVFGSILLSLDANYEIIDEYFKLLNSDLYIKYNMVEKSENSIINNHDEYSNYKNYILYDNNIVIGDNSKLYVDNDNYYMVNGGSYPIIIKDIDRYGIEYNNSLVYVNSSDILSIEDADNSDLDIASGIGVLNYHYTVSSSNENGELDECQQPICITDTMFDSHISYLASNNYYGVSMRDLELFIDGKINLPRKSVVITIDDGWYVARSIDILNKYKMNATLFLIGSLASPSAYLSPYLEIHSHTWNMHNIGDCNVSDGFGGGILCMSDEYILDDLRKSRESLNNTPYFCYPFYEYNYRSIELLKKAGFRMAFAGGEYKVSVGHNKYVIPRYVITNYTSMNEFISYVS